MRTEFYQGPDISKYQGNVDVKQIRDAGYKRIGIRVGYGKNNVDEKFTRNALACTNLGEPVILYWFSYAYNEAMAEKEAEYCIAQAAKYWQKCPIAFDFEYDSISYARKNGVEISKSLATKMAIAFLRRVKDAGYLPVIYSNRDYLSRYFDLAQIQTAVGGTYLWFALYGTIKDSEREIADIWQYTSTGKVPGVTGNVDMNRFYTDFETAAVETPPENSKVNINIQTFQRAANADGYRDSSGNELAEDGKDGPKTQYVRRKIVLKAQQTGSIYKAGSTGEVVKWWQQRCNEILGHAQTVDGKYGPTARLETIAVQKQMSLVQDGMAGYNSIQAAFYN